MNNYQAILQSLYPEGSIGPGTGIYQGQCAVFVETLMQIPKVGDTIQTKTAVVKKSGYTADQVQGGYCAGDAIIFNVGTPAGHVAFCNNIVNGVMTLSESNWNLDKKVHHTRTISALDKTIVGCLRGQLLFPIPAEKKTLIQKILILCYKIPRENMAQLQSGVKNYTDKVAAKTNEEFLFSCEYENTNGYFGVVQTDQTIYIQPHDVAVEGQKVQVKNKKQYDVVCLVYNSTDMTPKPNHPIEAPITEYGFNVIEIPLDWISSLNVLNTPLTIYAEPTELFFAHEMSHANYYLANKQGAGQRDKTHDIVALNPQIPSLTYYFLNYLLELKSYWKNLCH